MKKRFVLPVATFAVLLGAQRLTVSSMQVRRPPAPPAHSPIVSPWGSMRLESDMAQHDAGLEDSILLSIQQEVPGGFDPDQDGTNEYAILVLSGGGSAGAFGAGLLNGWTRAGTRPDFKVVTGVSAGALQSTFAFLGPDYDTPLTEVFTLFGGDDIYTRRHFLKALISDAAFDTAPLEALIRQYVTPGVLAAVARKHLRGHRLFMGTTNMDTGEFIIWDMGAIASSDRSDKLRRYQQVLLASASIPILFPPVYLDVEIDGTTYHQMHMDGGTHSQLFLRGFMLDLQDSFQAGDPAEGPEVSLYVIRNGTINEDHTHRPVEASSLKIATATIHSAFEQSNDTSLFRVYTLAGRYGMDFNMAAIPDGLFPELDPVIFDLATMRKVYDYGLDQGSKGYEWAQSPPGLDQDEIIVPAGNRAE